MADTRDNHTTIGYHRQIGGNTLLGLVYVQERRRQGDTSAFLRPQQCFVVVLRVQIQQPFHSLRKNRPASRWINMLDPAPFFPEQHSASLQLPCGLDLHRKRCDPHSVYVQRHPLQVHKYLDACFWD